MKFLKKFEESYSVKLPKEVWNLYGILDEYDYQCFFFNFDKLGAFLILREKYLNDGEVLKITFSEFTKDKKLIEIYEQKGNDILEENYTCFPFAIANNNLIGLFFKNKKFIGLYLIDFEGVKDMLYLSLKIEDYFFNNLDNNFLFNQYFLDTKELVKNKHVIVPEIVRYSGHFVYLHNKNDNLNIQSFKNVLDDEIYFLIDSEGFLNENDYKKLVNRINNIAGVDFEIVVNSNVKFKPFYHIQLSSSDIDTFIGGNDYLNLKFLELLNDEIEIITKRKKKLIIFRDNNFGQEIGIAFLDEKFLSDLKEIESMKIFNYKKGSYE